MYRSDEQHRRSGETLLRRGGIKCRRRATYHKRSQRCHKVSNAEQEQGIGQSTSGVLSAQCQPLGDHTC